MTRQIEVAALKCEPLTVVELLRERALRQPDALAYTFLTDGETDEINLTYRELDRQARAIGAHLQNIGAAGERVLLLYPQGLEYMAAFYGCLYAGAIAVPTYPPRLNQKLTRLLSIVNNSQATVAFTTSAVLSKLETMLDLEPSLKTLRWIATDTIADAQAEEWQAPLIGSDTLAFLQYTSGSTSVPKGVMVSHGNLLYNHRMLQSSFQPPENSTYVSWLPLFHDMGLIANALQSVYAGTRCVLMSPMSFLQRPFRWLQAISHYGAATSGGPNFSYDLCVSKVTPEQKAMLDLSSWTLAFNGAEPVRKETFDRFYAAFAECGFRREAFYPCYGLAEATVMVSGGVKGTLPLELKLQASALEQNRVVLASAGDPHPRTAISCGRTWLEQKIAIVNPETLKHCQPDEVGEIWVSGAHVAKGYWERLEETQHAFHALTMDTGEGPFMRTGDLGFMQGSDLFIAGRLKDLIIIDGSNHYPQDIERTVEQSHPAIRQSNCAAFAVEAEGEERLVVVAEVDHRRLVEPDAGAAAQTGVDAAKQTPTTETTIVRAIRRAVSENHDLSLHAVVLLKRGSLPKTTSGKIQRRACHEGFVKGTLRHWESNK